MWQCRALVEAKRRGGNVAVALLSVLAHNYDDAMPVLLRVAFPGFTSIEAPFLCSAGRVAKNGVVMADVVNRDGTITKNVGIYRNEMALRDNFRRLADTLSLTDAERIEMFKAVQRWVVADTRIDPSMDPRDPEAKRLVLH